MALEQIAEDLYVAHDSVRFFGFRIQTRMSVVVLSGRRLLLYSPVRPTEAVVRDLAALGDVAYLVAPNKIHNLALAACCTRYPGARLCLPPGLAERRPELPGGVLLGDAPLDEWGDELALTLTDGNVFFREVLLLHRRSRTLLVGDLVENFDDDTASPFGCFAARIFGVGRGPVASPEFRYYTHDAEAAAASFERTVSWDFGRIVPCHGAVVTADARSVLERVTREVVAGARRRTHTVRALLRTLAALQ